MYTVGQLLDLKGREFFAIEPQEPVLRAIEMMATRHVGALLVMKGETLLGVISERDYARKVILLNRSSHDTPVRDIMTSEVISVSPDHSVHRCMQIMTEQRVRHLPVLDHGKVAGILSIGDLVKAMLQEQSEHIEQLERYIAG